MLPTEHTGTQRETDARELDIEVADAMYRSKAGTESLAVLGVLSLPRLDGGIRESDARR